MFSATWRSEECHVAKRRKCHVAKRRKSCVLDNGLGVHGTLCWSGCFVPDKTPADTSQHNFKGRTKLTNKFNTMASVTPYYGKHHEPQPDDWILRFKPESEEALNKSYAMFQGGLLNIWIMHLELKRVVNEMEPSEMCFAFHQILNCFTCSNKEVLSMEARQWRNNVRRGLMKVKRDLCHSASIWGKTYYTLVLEAEDINPDPVLLLYFQYMVGGSYVYFFPNEKNRDSIFKFVNDLPKDQPIGEEKHEADA